MNTEDVTQAILIEIQSIIGGGWSATAQGSKLVVVGPAGPEFVSEVWRIARFIAYDDYVAIERQTADDRQYKITSRSGSDLAFEVTIRADG